MLIRTIYSRNQCFCDSLQAALVQRKKTQNQKREKTQACYFFFFFWIVDDVENERMGP